MRIPIGELIEAAHVSGLSKVRAINILKDSNNYSNCVIGNGKIIDGDKDELARYLRLICNVEEPDPEESPEAITDDQSLRNEIEILKEQLPSGSEYYEYKTIIIQGDLVLGTADADQIELTLTRYALKGWRLKTANVTVNNTILILERQAAKE